MIPSSKSQQVLEKLYKDFIWLSSTDPDMDSINKLYSREETLIKGLEKVHFDESDCWAILTTGDCAALKRYLVKNRASGKVVAVWAKNPFGAQFNLSKSKQRLKEWEILTKEV